MRYLRIDQKYRIYSDLSMISPKLGVYLNGEIYQLGNDMGTILRIHIVSDSRTCSVAAEMPSSATAVAVSGLISPPRFYWALSSLFRMRAWFVHDRDPTPNLPHQIVSIRQCGWLAGANSSVPLQNQSWRKQNTGLGPVTYQLLFFSVNRSCFEAPGAHRWDFGLQPRPGSLSLQRGNGFRAVEGGRRDS